MGIDDKQAGQSRLLELPATGEGVESAPLYACTQGLFTLAKSQPLESKIQTALVTFKKFERFVLFLLVFNETLGLNLNIIYN